MFDHLSEYLYEHCVDNILDGSTMNVHVESVVLVNVRTRSVFDSSIDNEQSSRVTSIARVLVIIRLEFHSINQYVIVVVVDIILTYMFYTICIIRRNEAENEKEKEKCRNKQITFDFLSSVSFS
jgi:hypothetical protein